MRTGRRSSIVGGGTTIRLAMLLDRLAARHGNLNRGDCNLAVNTLLRAIVGHLAGGGRVEIRGFGSFVVKSRNARLGRNPRTGAGIFVPAKAAVYFKSGSQLRNGVNRGKQSNNSLSVNDSSSAGLPNKWTGLG